MLGPTEIVKSKYIVDPNDQFNMILREDNQDPDREYWERVNQDRDNVSSVAKIFEESQQGDVERRQSFVKVGKLKIDSFLENFTKNEDTYRDQLQVGKLNADDFLTSGSKNDDIVKNEIIKVGKLNIKEDSLFESSNESMRPMINIGKLNANDIYNPSPTEEKSEIKLYKPVVQPKKIKMKTFFEETPDDEQIPSKHEIKVGKIDANCFLRNVEDNLNEATQTPKQVRVGKLDANKMFCPEESTNCMTDEGQPIPIGKIRLSEVFPTEQVEQQKQEVIRVGKLKQNIYETKDDTSDVKPQREVQVGKIKHSFLEPEPEKEETDKVVLRGARKVNKGNRVSCLIENLHTNKKNDSDEEDKDTKEEDREVEEMKLGEDRMSAIKNMFLTNNDRIESPDNQMNQKSIPRKLKVNENIFQHNRDDYTDCDRLEVRVGKLDNNIFKPVSEEYEPNSRNSPAKIGKLNVDSIYPLRTDEIPAVTNNENNVGKIDTSNIFKDTVEETDTTGKTTFNVGKLSKDVFNPTTESSQSNKSTIKVGKISTKDLFQKTMENCEELQDIVRVGKLSDDKLIVGSKELSNEKEDDKQTIDPDILSLTGSVSEKANAFLNSSKTEKKSPPRLSTPTIKRSESSAASDMQKKYQEQMASKGLKRNHTERDIRDKKSTPVTKSEKKSPSVPVTKTEKKSPPVFPVTTIKFPIQDREKVEQSKDRSCEEKDEEVEIVEHKHENAAMLAGAALEAATMKDARQNFFKSMITSSGQNTSAHRLGTSILSADDLRTTPGTSRGKSLFQRQAEKAEEMESEQEIHQQILPGVDLEEIEDEFEKLHREMMNETK